MNPSAWALRHPVPVAVITAGAVLFGLLSLLSLNREFVPPMLLPSSTVITIWPGVGAEDVEREVTSILEDSFATMSGITDISSESREGVSIITLKFTREIDEFDRLLELRNRVDRVLPDLPEGINGKPSVSTWGAADLPVFTFSVFAPADSDWISGYVEEELVPELYKVEGVAEAIVLGDRRKIVDVRLDPVAAGFSNVTLTDVLGAIQGRNGAVPAGLVDWGGSEWALRVSGEFRDLSELEGLVVGFSGGDTVRLGDIGVVSLAYEQPDEFIRSGGENLIVIQVTKRESGNSIRMSRELRERLEILELHNEYGVRFTVLHDDSETVRMSLNAVIRSALIGIAMAVAVLWLFLMNWRYTIVVAVSLPVSLVLTFAGMKLAGQSVNVLTLAGLTVSLGMIVDASIVVLENIHRRHDAGESGMQSALIGAGAVSGAVIASTTTSVCVFIPMLFLGGIAGIVMKDLSITIVLCLGASLFSALMLVPPLTGRILSATLRDTGQRREGRFIAGMERMYRASLKHSLGMSRTVIITAAVILIISILSAGMMGLSFIPSADYDELFISLELSPGSSLEESMTVADRADAVLRKEVAELRNLVFYVGMENDLVGEARKREFIWTHLLLDSSKRRKRDFREIIDDINRILPRALPGVEVTVLNGGFDRLLSMGTDGSGYRIELTSESWKKLTASAERMEDLLSSDPEIVGIARDVTEDRLFLSAALDEDALDRSGVNPKEAAYAMRIAFGGQVAGELRPSEGPDRTIRLTSDLENTLPDSSALIGIPVRSASGRILSLDSLAEVRVESGVSGIRRRDRARTITVIAYTRGENIRDIDRRFREALNENPLPEGVDWKLQGVGSLIGDSLGNLGLILLISLFLVYAVMAIQFEKFIQPLIIMASVPFCFIGVVGGLAMSGSDISIISFLGIIALGGIVVNNAIIQVDRMNQLRREGMSLDESVVEGAVGRLRPILMTTLTTFIGVIPLSMARGAGARIYAPLGQAIAGGLVTSTLVTLFLIPSIYRLVEGRMEGSSEGLISDSGRRSDDGAA